MNQYECLGHNCRITEQNLLPSFLLMPPSKLCYITALFLNLLTSASPDRGLSGHMERIWWIACTSKGSDQPSNKVHASSKFCRNGINPFVFIVSTLIMCQRPMRGFIQIVSHFTVSGTILSVIWNWCLMKEERRRLAFEAVVWWYISICCNLLPYSDEENVCLGDLLRSIRIFRWAFSEVLFLLFIAGNTKTKGALQTEDGIHFQKKPHIFIQCPFGSSRTFTISENKYDCAVNSLLVKEMCQHCELSLVAEKVSRSWGML